MKHWVVAMCLLSGCDTITRNANALGEHMPVIGDRCEYWQCFTESGREQSDAIKRQRMMTEGAASRAAPDSPAPAAQTTSKLPPARKPVPQRRSVD